MQRPYEFRHRLRRHPAWWEDHVLVPWSSVCRIRVLMVADGATFDEGGGYKLSRVLEALQHDLPPYVRIDVTTARHGSVSDHDSADINGLRFDTHDLDRYDQIWLFAVQRGDALQPGEATALWHFMQGGGGVFATGDHENLGEALCARIPRVRSMRRWYWDAPGPNGEPVAPYRDVGGGRGEKDTTTTPAGNDFDGVPQTISPKLYTSYGPGVFIRRQYPHPVLCGGEGMIDVLPDHMHEGLIEVPADLEMPISVDGNAVEEYPRRGAHRLPPEVIAHSTINNNPGDGPFGVIGAYDGHLVDEIAGGVGRVVVDATWHHFWNMNVNQFADAHDAVATAVGAGSSPDPADVAPAEAWESIRDYFQNIAFWLARRSTQSCIRRRGMWFVAHHLDVLMVLEPLRFDRTAHLIGIGQKARDALQQVAPQCERLRIVWDLPILDVFELPWRPPFPDPPPFEPQIPLLDAGLAEDLVLGAQVETVANLAREVRSEKDLEALLGADEFDERLARSSMDAVEALATRLRGDADRLSKACAR